MKPPRWSRHWLELVICSLTQHAANQRLCPACRCQSLRFVLWWRARRQLHLSWLISTQGRHVLISALLDALERKQWSVVSTRFVSFIRRLIHVGSKASKSKTALGRDSGFRLRSPLGLVSLLSRVWFWLEGVHAVCMYVIMVWSDSFSCWLQRAGRAQQSRVMRVFFGGISGEELTLNTSPSISISSSRRGLINSRVPKLLSATSLTSTLLCLPPPHSGEIRGA